MWCTTFASEPNEGNGGGAAMARATWFILQGSAGFVCMLAHGPDVSIDAQPEIAIEMWGQDSKQRAPNRSLGGI